MESIKQDNTGTTNGISAWSCLKLYGMLENERDNLKRLYKSDIVEFFIRLEDFLNIERTDSEEEKRVFGEIKDAAEQIGGFAVQDRILSLANAYGIAAYDNGFKHGFETAARIGAGGAKGGAAL